MRSAWLQELARLLIAAQRAIPRDVARPAVPEASTRPARTPRRVERQTTR